MSMVFSKHRAAKAPITLQSGQGDSCQSLMFGSEDKSKKAMDMSVCTANTIQFDVEIPIWTLELRQGAEHVAECS